MTVFQFKRGTREEHEDYVGDPGEITVLVDDGYRPVVHDGVTSGGIPLAFADEDADRQPSDDGGRGIPAFVRDFETGDAALWDADAGFEVRWPGSLAGDYSLHFDGRGDTDDSFVAETTFERDEYAGVSWLWRVPSVREDGRPQVWARSGETDAFLVAVDDGGVAGAGHLLTWDGDEYVDTGVELDADTTYEVTVSNVDYDDGRFDVSARTLDGDRVGRSSNHAFWGDATGVDALRVVGAGTEQYVDNVAVDRPA
ncbi:hyaluronate lyase N-terminal domain-containing protein [Halobacterium litoreum]|uniref:Major tropism determinant N-terminal domain-containing protein n=1 Tax=Halobacterium litoreum TaxID=2039234 RepID=A0ABD5NGM6_9EURY|nr:hypothetical protein [Halobacterium litoreum]UHH12950.1 hypothetical protein LT972_12390 [Halobacterium litoreum]